MARIGDVPVNPEELRLLREVATTAQAMIDRADKEGLFLGMGRTPGQHKEGPMAAALRRQLKRLRDAQGEM